MSQPRGFIRLAATFYGGVIAVAWLYAWIFDHLPELFGTSRPTFLFLMQGVLIGLIIVGACHAGFALMRPVRRASMMMAKILGPLRLRDAAWLALLSALGEEMMFRGALWPHLGLIGGAVLFGLLHTIPVRALAGYPIFAFLAGIALGLLREQSGSIWPAVACHFTVNALNLAWLGQLERKRLGRRLLRFETDLSEKGQEAEDLPVPQEVGDQFPRTVWRYHLRVEISGTDRMNLPDCLESEDLALFQVVAREEVYRELADGLFVFADEFQEPFIAFPDDVAAISTYLFQVITGVEVAERMVDEETTDDVRAWKISSRRGEWVKVPLLVEETAPGIFEVDPDREDLEVMAAHWSEYPRWFQDGMRFKYPALREL
ncbi:MAG: lysostaphin resistance A-like protein [Planctomycetota bacterium]